VRYLFELPDSTIWVGTDAGMFIYDPVTEHFKAFNAKTADGRGVTGSINDIKADRAGNIWIGVYSQGVFRYNAVKEELVLYEHQPDESSGLSSNYVWCLYVDEDDMVWIGTLAGGLNRFNAKTGDFSHFSVKGNNSLNDVYKILGNDNQSLLLGTPDQGVLSFDRITGEMKPYLQENKPLFVRDMMYAEPHKLWIGTESGLYIYDKEKNHKETVIRNVYDKYSLSSNAIYSIYRDREGGIWIGTYFGGVNYLPSQHNMFRKYYSTSPSNNISGSAVREFNEDKYGNLWIGTEDAGLFYFNTKTQTLSPFDKVRYHNVHGIKIDGDSLWVGYFTKGMDLIDLKTGKKNIFTSSPDSASLSDNNVFSIYKDTYKNTWIGTIYGLNVLSEGSSKVKRVGETGSNTFIYDILESKKGIIWFASYENGVFLYNPRTDSWQQFRHQENDPSSLASDKTINLFEDSSGTMWVSTEGAGVSAYDPATKRFKTYTTLDGLPNNVVYKVLEDDAGNLWMSTNKGLALFHPKTEKFTTYTHSNGLLSDQFNYKSGIKTKDGKLYFGSIDGFICFDPQNIKTNDTVPPIVLTGFQVFNKEIAYGNGSPLQASIVKSKKIELSHKQNSFSFDFAALSFKASEMNRYAYLLEGYDRDWIHITNNGRASYTNIPSGKYTFKVKGANSDNTWNQKGASVDVIIHPPFWSSTKGILLEALLMATVLFYFIVAIIKRQGNKNRRRVEIMEMENEKALHKAKLDFFINIAHEIRTPLSLIKGPYEQVSQKELSPANYKENIEIMGNNINRLLDLTNQLLDFSKAENHGLSLNLSLTNVNKVIESVLFRFKSALKAKNLEVTVNLPKDSVITLVDNEALTKILSNLINNANKFADHHIHIELNPEASDEGYYSIKISNDGKLILPENRELIFEAFFQEQNRKETTGTGLGLSLVKLLVDLHQGRIYVDKNITERNCFVVELPFLKNDSAASIEEDYPSENIPDAPKTYDTHILIVEDDFEMRRFLKSVFSEHYAVSLANNGMEALDILDKGDNIDLIVSDIMMPLMDGYELCRNIKSRVEHCHIPVILLTAKNNISSKLEGLDVGADAYMEKPFSTNYLFGQISNMLKNRRLIKEAFLNNPTTESFSIVNNKIDEKFLEKVNEIIYKHIADETFSINQLAGMLYMSRSTLQRKIKAISNLTPNDYINLVRLKEAAKLLQSDEHRVNEICYLVGFNSPSYFTKCFQQQFGIKPKDYVKNQNR
jgi:ligand-binding sensor domain-containing protein/signal transduction histidine kinase/DNA-binding response OmpR family regulator